MELHFERRTKSKEEKVLTAEGTASAAQKWEEARGI